MAELSEEDVKYRYITPALVKSGWENFFRMEAQLTDGRVDLRGNKPTRRAPKRADYLLYASSNDPIAVVEAKSLAHGPSDGIQQAIEYAKMLDLPFAYSTNGESFRERDLLTGRERDVPLDEFPTREELQARREGESGWTPDQKKIAEQPFYQSGHSPRYYQRVAVNRTLNAIARGQNRLLLVMATGTGKTFVAFQIVYRLLKSGMKHKILYLADRNVLVDQSVSQDFKPLESTVHKIDFARDDKIKLGSYEVYFALYQQMMGLKEDPDANPNDDSIEEGSERYKEFFAPDFFDLIIVDECHRGSAKADSNWRRILEYFSGATQIGMTATPKESKEVSNIDYFGEPIYKYSLREGIDDGFLAPFRVVNYRIDVDQGWRPTVGQLDKNGQEIEDREYNSRDYDRKIVLEDRVDRVARCIVNFMRARDPMAKTIVFCEQTDAAARMRDAIVKHCPEMVKKYPDYAMRITGDDPIGKSKLDYFISLSAPTPVIATTSQLLSTGVDTKMAKVIVFDKTVTSPIEFKQIIGRGTRLNESLGKTHFTILDFRNATSIFADPDWDGPTEIDPDFDPERVKSGSGEERTKPDGDPEEPEKKGKPIVDVSGCRVALLQKVVAIYDADGKLLRQESIVDYARRNMLGKYATLDEFINNWTTREKRDAVKSTLSEFGVDLDQLKAEQRMTDVDDFDFLCSLAYGRRPLSRRERAAAVRKGDFFERYSGVARDVLEALLDRYMDDGFYEFEDTNVLKLEPFARFGKTSRIAREFGGPEKYREAVRALERALYSTIN